MTMDPPVDFSSWLRLARSRHDLTQEALAEAVGCATQSIRSFENGRRRPSRAMAARILDVLHVPPNERAALLRLARPPLMVPEPAQLATASSAAPAAASRQAPRPASLIGREAELARLRQALLEDGRRLVTVLGSGGIGKTCLALQCSADLAAHFADGTAFVALASVAEAGTLVTAIAEAVGCSLAGAPNPTHALQTFLSDRELLLVLDNVEQLLGPTHDSAAGDVLGAILAHAPAVRLVVTSRERLRRRDEWVIAVDGLTLPDHRPGAPLERASAVILFLERARQVDAEFALSPHNLADVARICRLLGGVPLAIELAAAWTRVLSCTEIAAEVARDASLLSENSHDRPLRHRSLRAVLDHSWQLRAPAERQLLAHLSVFEGGCRRDAIAAVFDPSLSPATLLPIIGALVDASLIRAVRVEDGTTRYALHEFVRQYAAAQLAIDPAVEAAAQTRHAVYYAAWVAAQELGLKSARQRTTGAAITGEIANVRRAWQWACLHQDAALLRELLPTLDWFYELRGWYDEASAVFARAAAAIEAAAAAPDAPELSRVAYWLTVGRTGFHALRRDPAFAVRHLDASVAALRQLSRSGEQIHCLKGLAYVHMFAGNYAGAETLLDEARAIAVARGDDWNLAMTLVIGGVMAVLRSEPHTAQQQLTVALRVARTVGDPRPIAMALTYLGLIALTLDDVDAAERSVREAHLLATEHADRFQISLSLQVLGRIALARSEHAEATWLLGESLVIAREIGDRWLEAQAVGCQADIAVGQGDPMQARNLRRGALAIAAAAPLPIALDEAAALAVLELHARPAAALATLAYVLHHPLTRPVTRAAVAAHWDEATRQRSAEHLAAAEAVAQDLPHEHPTAVLDLLGAL